MGVIIVVEVGLVHEAAGEAPSMPIPDCSEIGERCSAGGIARHPKGAQNFVFVSMAAIVPNVVDQETVTFAVFPQERLGNLSYKIGRLEGAGHREILG